MGYTLYYTVISMGTHIPPPSVDGKLLMVGTLKELNVLQWGQMKRANPCLQDCPKSTLQQCSFIVQYGSATFSILMCNFVLFLLICLYIFCS